MKLILFMLLLGILYRLAITWDGNFLFNMDNARDMVEVREMVILKKPRLTGPTSAIAGLYNGPAWYYLLAIPFILSGGDPYASIIMEIILWAFGGFFLLKLISRWGNWLILPIGLIWLSSDYIMLTTRYAFNPNPVTLLAPVFIYGLSEYLNKQRGFWIIMVWFLGGLFFNFEMNIGIWMPMIILASIYFTKKRKLFKDKFFWVGVGMFIFTLLPQVIFDLKHQFLMSKSLIRFLIEGHDSYNLLTHLYSIPYTFYHTFLPIVLNNQILSWIISVTGIFIIINFFKKKDRDITMLVSLVFLAIPFFGYLILPVTINLWHLGGPMVASIVLIGFLLKKLFSFGIKGKLLAISITFLIILSSILNINYVLFYELRYPNADVSLYKNEIAAIDYVYKFAQNQNFKVYTYLPSVYDYPYQYLFWWYGLKKYGYLPKDYAYAPKMPNYIANKEKFSAREEDLKKRPDSNLVFLIKEPNNNYTRFGWEGNFVSLVTLEKQNVGPIEIEVKKE